MGYLYVCKNFKLYVHLRKRDIMNLLKEKVKRLIMNKRQELISLSHQIHEHPETAFNEKFSSKQICLYLEKEGFKVINGFGGLETAFYAEAKGKTHYPKIAVLAEYDALKGIGHGCGHNIIAASAVGAFISVASVISELNGTICIIGTPAEEGGGGKVIMLQNGAFDDVNFAMMMHPNSGNNLVFRSGRAAVNMKIVFKGKAAHSADPSKGINALNAMIELFNGLNIMRASMPQGANVNGIITEGGTVANIIPDCSRAEFSIRGNTLQDLDIIVKMLRDSIASSERLIGVQTQTELGQYYAERYPNKPMSKAFKANIESLGEKIFYPDPEKQYGSSDIGNVSIQIPTIHEYLSIAPESVNAHTKEFAACAVSKRADDVCLLGAKGLAMTAIDLFIDKELRKEAADSHNLQIPNIYKKK